MFLTDKDYIHDKYYVAKSLNYKKLKEIENLKSLRLDGGSVEKDSFWRSIGKALQNSKNLEIFK